MDQIRGAGADDGDKAQGDAWSWSLSRNRKITIIRKK